MTQWKGLPKHVTHLQRARQHEQAAVGAAVDADAARRGHARGHEVLGARDEVVKHVLLVDELEPIATSIQFTSYLSIRTCLLRSMPAACHVSPYSPPPRVLHREMEAGVFGYGSALAEHSACRCAALHSP